MIRRLFTFVRAAPRQWVEGVYCLDERLYERMQASRTFAIAASALVEACVLAVCWLAARGPLGATYGRRTALVVAVVFSGLVAVALRHKLAVQRAVLMEHRSRAGLCPACGYDLRATPEKGGALLDRCPECGAAPAGSAREAGR